MGGEENDHPEPQRNDRPHRDRASGEKKDHRGNQAERSAFSLCKMGWKVMNLREEEKKKKEQFPPTWESKIVTVHQRRPAGGLYLGKGTPAHVHGAKTESVDSAKKLRPKKSRSELKGGGGGHFAGEDQRSSSFLRRSTESGSSTNN